MPLLARLLPAGVASLLLAATFGATPAVAAGKTAHTSAVEAHRVDRVRTPKLGWYRCYRWAQCATTTVPLDYDRPHGQRTTVALLRVKATDQKHKIGTLFVNPGGPGVPATTFALLAPLFLSDSLLARFDIVGMDPRGIGASDNVACFADAGRQNRALAGMQAPFPYGPRQERLYVAAAKKLGRACSTHGRRLAGAMSTAEVARDLDVMRRAVGDKKLSYLGFSYGTELGQVYANMFPDRFRAIAVDGVINPKAWVGTKRSGNTVQDERLRSADGAYRAFQTIMQRCAAAGPARCAFAGGNPLNKFATVAARLKKHPVEIAGDGLLSLTETYADFISDVLLALYSPAAGDEVTFLAQQMWVLTTPGGGVSPAELSKAGVAYGRRVRALRGFPYDNSLEAYAAVMCTDARHPKDAGSWPALAAKADRRAPYFGRAWAWASVQCARDTWTVRDEDAYTGPFTRRTASPVLLVGSLWDPATNYRDAQGASRLLPNSRLLSSDNWGHTAYGTNACATAAVDAYLLRKRLPAKGTLCHAPQPFQTALPTEPDPEDLLLSTDALEGGSVDRIVARGLPAQGAPKQLPPVNRLTR